MLLISAAMAQTPPQIQVPAQQLPPVLLEGDYPKTIDGSVLAYDWATRYYMEGARVESFIFKVSKIRTFFRVISLWHPADKPRILPENFYTSAKKWRLTVRATTPFDFVRQYCEKEAAPTFSADLGEGRNVELRRYVSPASLPPNAGVPQNFKTALSNPPTSPPMPDPRSMPCVFLDKVTAVGR
jgi:hypothetical protein